MFTEVGLRNLGTQARAKQYLVAHGIAAGRIEALSNGKERPLDPAHSPEAWAKNRNDQFDVLTTNVVLR